MNGWSNILMKSRLTYKNLAWLLAVILFTSPVNFAMAGDFMSHAEMTHENSSMNVSHTNHEISDGSDHQSHKQNNKTDENNCQVECANCVYCSASNISSSDNSLLFYRSSTPEAIQYFAQSIDINVDIRPPINI